MCDALWGSSGYNVLLLIIQSTFVFASLSLFFAFCIFCFSRDFRHWNHILELDVFHKKLSTTLHKRIAIELSQIIFFLHPFCQYLNCKMLHGGTFS